MNEQELAAAVVAALTGASELAVLALADHFDERGLAGPAEALRDRARSVNFTPRRVAFTVYPETPPFAVPGQKRPWFVDVDVPAMVRHLVRTGLRTRGRRSRYLYGTVRAVEV